MLLCNGDQATILEKRIAHIHWISLYPTKPVYSCHSWWQLARGGLKTTKTKMSVVETDLQLSSATLNLTDLQHCALHKLKMYQVR